MLIESLKERVDELQEDAKRREDLFMKVCDMYGDAYEQIQKLEENLNHAVALLEDKKEVHNDSGWTMVLSMIGFVIGWALGAALLSYFFQ